MPGPHREQRILSLRATVRELGGHLRPRRWSVAAGCGLLVVSAGVGLLQPLASQRTLDLLARGEDLTTAILVLSGLVVLSALALGTGTYLLLSSAESVVFRGRRRLAGHILRLSMRSMQRQAPGDLLSRVTADTTLLRQIAIQAVAQALLGGVTLIGALALMFYVDAVLLGVVVIVLLAMGISLGLVMPHIREAAGETQSAVGHLGAQMERALEAFSMVKAAGREETETARVEDAAAEAKRSGRRVARLTAVASTSSGLSTQVAFLVILGVGGARVENGSMSIGALVAFLLYVFYLTGPALQLINSATFFQAGRAALARIADVEDLAVEPPRSGAGGAAAPEGAAAVALDGVTFAYEDAGRPALEDVTLELPAGGLTALVGPSGAGKTTVFALLERFFDPDEGALRLDGTDLRTLPLGDVRRRIALVQQETPVLSGTLRENLEYFQEEPVEEAELRDVLEACGLEALLHRLGDDLDAEVATRGTSLSGGERQRIAVARALLRRPQLLLLDEATSQLDAANEEALRRLIERVARRTTVIASAHRLSTIRSAARIVVLEEGRVRAVGSHDELLERDELYRSYVTAQREPTEPEAEAAVPA